MNIQQTMSLTEKLAILADAAKYDVACTSSGVDRKGDGKGMGNTFASGLCHAFAADGRCVSLLKILFTNECIFNCAYCQNNCNNDLPRAAFTPEEICTLTMEFYRRNYIEGLFLSSGILVSPNYTMDLIYQTLLKLRQEHHFNGYIHVKAIPGADPALIARTGFLADRMSINLELPTANGLKQLAPYKSRATILKPMRQIQTGITENKHELAIYKKAPQFVPAGQSTQMIIGATPENDYQIMSVTEALYQKFGLKRVFYSAFVNVNCDTRLPMLPSGPPLLREHRLYQADWLLRFYGFRAEELLDEDDPNFNPLVDPKCSWALKHPEFFPVEVNTASREELLRVPGVGTVSAKRILYARRARKLEHEDLRKMGIVMKRAQYFVTCKGKILDGLKLQQDSILRNLIAAERAALPGAELEQLSLFGQAG